MMNTDEVNITNNGGSMQINESIIGSSGSNINTRSAARSSSNPEDIQELLRQLGVAVAQISQSLPAQHKQEVERSLQVLTEEASKEKPSRRWYTVSIAGLAEAAKDIGEIGKPILEILAKIAPHIDKIAL
jgi:hypothetical protein